jgi:hypothetical protein
VTPEDPAAAKLLDPCTQAVAFAELLTRALSSSGDPDPHDLAVIAQSMKLERLRRGFPQTARYRRVRRLAIYATVLWVPVFAVCWMFVYPSVPSSGIRKLFAVSMLAAFFSGFYAPVVLACWLWAFGVHRTRRIDHRVTVLTICPACDYELRTIEPMLEPTLVGGIWMGPERCPECGLHWPLVPKELGGQNARLDEAPKATQGTT